MTAVQAVLTGDLVGSSQCDPASVDRAMDILSGVARGIAGWQTGEDTTVGDTRFTRYRGDGWQVLVSAGHLGLRAAILMYARLAADPTLPATRVAIGLGDVDVTPGPDLASARGAAFTVSGRALANMERAERLKVAGDGITPEKSAFLALLDERLADWTPEQAEAIAHVIPPDAPTQSAIAAKLGISPQALSLRLAGARWKTTKRLLIEWEKSRRERMET